MLHTALLHSPHARSRVRRIDLAPAEAAPGVLAAIGPGEVDGVGEEADFEGYAVAAVAAETLEQAEAAVAADRDRLGGARAAARPEVGGRARVARLRVAPLRARRLRARARRGGRGRRVRLHHPDAQPQLDGDPPVRLPLARRRDRRLPLDAGHLGGPQRARARSCAARGQGAGDLRVHGRRLRLEGRGRQLPAAGRRARAPHGTAGAQRPDAARREHGLGQPQRDDAAGDGRRASRRNADRPRRRVHVRARLGRLAAADRRPHTAPLRLRERTHGRARREAEPAPDGRLPRAGLRRGHVVARVRARQARRAARARPARAAEAGTTRTPTRWTGGRTRRRA